MREYVDHKLVIEPRGTPPIDTLIAVVTFDEQDDITKKVSIYNIGIDNPSITDRSTQEEQLVWAQDIIDNYTHAVTPLPEVVSDFTDELRSQLEEIDFDSATDLAALKTKLKEFKSALLGKRVGDTARIAGEEKV